MAHHLTEEHLARSAVVMGICNVTPDSFFDGGSTDPKVCISRGRQLFSDGALVVDVGGESTRPGAVPVSVTQEIQRVLPVIEELGATGVVSIDTTKDEVARLAVGAGATLINDVSGTLGTVAAELGVGYIAMHSRGTPQTMADLCDYTDVVDEVFTHCMHLGRQATAAGCTMVFVDPGLGFAKTAAQSRALLANVDQLCDAAHAEGLYVAIGASRKSFLSTSSSGEALLASERLEGSVGAAAMALSFGVDLVRVHDVRETIMAAGLVPPRGEPLT